MYGPFWIYSTMVFLLTFVGNIHNDKIRYSAVGVSASVIFGIGYGVPVLLYVMMTVFGSKPKILELICIYGYSFTTLTIGVIFFVLPHHVSPPPSYSLP